MTNIAPRANGSFRRQSFGNLGQKSKTHFLFGPPPADEVDTSPVHEETLTLDPSGDKLESKEASRLESNNDDNNVKKVAVSNVSLPLVTQSTPVDRSKSSTLAVTLPRIGNSSINTPQSSTLDTLATAKKNRKRRKKKVLSASALAKVRETDKFVDAASEGRLEEVVYRIRNGQEVDAQDSTSRFTAMLYAAKFGRNKCLRVLLEYGANVNQAHEISKKTAIHLASEAGRANEVQVLLDAGADKSIRDKDGNTPLDLCEEYHFEEVRAKLRDPPMGMEVPVALEFSTTHVSFCWKEPISLGAEIDEYRVVWKLESDGPWMENTTANTVDLQWDEEGFGYGDPISDISPKLRKYTISNLAPACTITLAIRAHNAGRLWAA